MRGEIISDGKLSLILNRIRHLSRGRCSDEVIKSIFLEHLPESCRAVLAISDTDDLSRLASMADRIVSCVPNQRKISAVSAKSDLMAKIAELTVKVDSLSTRVHTSRESTNCTVARVSMSKKIKVMVSSTTNLVRGHINVENLVLTFRSTRRETSSTAPYRGDGCVDQIRQPALYELYAANNSRIKARVLELGFCFRRPISWSSGIADVPYPIIGADLISAFGLIVDLCWRRIVDSLTGCQSPCGMGNVSLSGVSVIDKSCSFSKILLEFPEIIGLKQSTDVVSNGVLHHIITTSPPVAERARRLAHDKLLVVRAHFQELQDAGRCRPSKSPWAAPLHMNLKKKSEWRCCGDYRRLNARTIPDRYPVPYLQGLANILHGKSVFSKLNLLAAYNQIPISLEDIPKTAVITPFGLFGCTVMTFGLRNAGQTFERYLNQILGDIEFVFTCIDDILIASCKMEEHLAHLRLVFRRLREASLKLNVGKYQFGLS